MGKLGHAVVLTALAIGVLLAVPFPMASADSGVGFDQETRLASDDPCNKTASQTFSLSTTLQMGLCIITVKRNQSIATQNYTTLHISTLNLKGNDSLNIYDGNHSLTANKVVTMTGMRDSFTVVVQSPKAYLVINITANNSGSQMRGTYSSSGCEITKNVSTSVYVLSPLYLPARTDFTCKYTISRADNSSNSQLALSFLEVCLPNATLNITSSKEPPVWGSALPPDVYSSGTLQMALSVQNVSVTQNFSASLAPIIQSEVCGVTKQINGTGSVNIAVPEHHSLSYDCRVTLKAVKNDSSLLLNITSLHLTSGGDRVQIIDGPSLGNRVLAQLTEASPGYLVLSSGKQVIVRLIVDELIGKRNLAIDVFELSSSHHMFTPQTFHMSRPATGLLTTQYFLLEVAATSKVLFNLGAENATEKYDYTISVHDGPQTSSPLLVTFSSSVRFPVMSTGNVLLVVADFTNTSEGLNASFTTATGCDQVTSASAGRFKLVTSPTVPALCRWTITALPTSSATILMDLTAMKLEKQATVSVYSGVSGSGSLVALLKASNVQPGTVLPRIAIPASQWAQLVFSAENGTNLTSVDVQARFQMVDSLCGGQIQGAHGHIRSPGFPNLYPLNVVCKWTLPPSAPGRQLFFDFPQFQLADGHSMQFSEQMSMNSSRVLRTFRGSSSLPDFLYASNVTNVLTLSAQLMDANVTNQVAQGFDVEYWVLNCGGNQTKSSAAFSSPGANSSLCVWTITLPAPTDKGSVNVVNMTLSVGTHSLKDMVKVYDGNSLRAPMIQMNGSTSTVLSRFNAVIIVYNKTSSSSVGGNSNVSLQVNYTTFNCDKNHQCDNGICLHPDWLCNGRDDCGDNTDEQNCVSPPAPAPQTGVKAFVAAVLFFIGLIVGVILVVVIPRIIRRFRTNRYTAFENMPADA